MKQKVVAQAVNVLVLEHPLDELDPLALVEMGTRSSAPAVGKPARVGAAADAGALTQFDIV